MTNNCNLEKSVPPLVKKIVDPLPRLKMHNPLGNVHSNNTTAEHNVGKICKNVAGFAT